MRQMRVVGFGLVAMLIVAAAFAAGASLKKYSLQNNLGAALEVKHSKNSFPMLGDYGKLVTASKGVLVYQDAAGVVRVIDRGTFGSNKWDVIEYHPKMVEPPK